VTDKERFLQAPFGKAVPPEYVKEAGETGNKMNYLIISHIFL
jgi:hypothetical protein